MFANFADLYKETTFDFGDFLYCFFLLFSISFISALTFMISFILLALV